MFKVFVTYLCEKFGILDPLTLSAWQKVANLILECMHEAITEQGMMAGISSTNEQQDCAEENRLINEVVHTDKRLAGDSEEERQKQIEF